MNKEISEIAKLTGRISKDPKSKLFVPLAEEYKKAGDMEMAIHVLLEGLKRNPEYVIARSSLGKLLIAKGDLAGAQKEFEDVVKISPDNLMAQKKLGDLLILQNRPHDALPHYKIALSLNPDDGELASLISDVEAGRDVRSMIQVTKAKTTAEKAVKQEPSASGASPKLTPGFVPPQPSNVGPETPIETPPAPPEVLPAPIAETEKTPVFSMTETEEPEEVLVVEPLEPETSIQEPPAAGIVLPGVNEERVAPSVDAEESFDFDLPAGDQLPDESVISQDIGHETEMLDGDDRGTIPAGVSEETDADEIIDTGSGEEVVEQLPEPSFGDVSDKSDDFTTDTLAELYISQGFFEKAIEIYERMLGDKPNSRGLQDKLSWVRAEVARTVAPASEQKKEEDIFSAQSAEEYVPVSEAGEVVTEPREDHLPQQNEDTTGFNPEAGAQAREYVPTVEPDEVLIEAEVITEPGEFGPGEKSSEENTFSGSGEYKPASGPIEQSSTRDDAPFNVFEASPVQAPQHRDFEPREYVPPNQEQELQEPTSQQERATRVLNTAGRKETIARLESWLAIIKKEK
jgi:tetratricopeptide (TPR) repeat protein